MHNRFNNPHIGFHHPQQPNMYSGNNNSNTNAQMFNPNMPVNHPGVNGFNPNMPLNYPNMHMQTSTPNNNMMNPNMQPGMMINPGMMNPNMQPGMMMNPGMMNPNMYMMPPGNNQNRPNMGTTANLGMTNNTANEFGNRFSSNSNDNTNQKTVSSTQDFNVIPVFEVSNISNITFPNCNNVKLPVNVAPINMSDIINFDTKYITDCFSEAVECIIENSCKHSKENNVKTVMTAQKAIITEKIYDVTKQDEIDNLFIDDIDNLHKELKKLYKDSKTKNEIVLYKKLDQQLTDTVNNYLYINSSSRVTIDSFLEDFVSLKKHLTNNEPEVIDNFNLYLVNYIDLYNQNSISIKESDSMCCNLSTFICSEETFVFIDYMSCEIGLDKIDSDAIMHIPKKSINNFLISLIMNISEMTEVNIFNIVTIEKDIYKLYKSEKEDFYISKIE